MQYGSKFVQVESLLQFHIEDWDNIYEFSKIFVFVLICDRYLVNLNIFYTI